MNLSYELPSTISVAARTMTPLYGPRIIVTLPHGNWGMVRDNTQLKQIHIIRSI